MGNNKYRHHGKPNSANDYQPPYPQEKLDTPISNLNLSLETLDILNKGGINTICDIVKRRAQEMYRVQNFNKKRLFEVKNAIAPLGVDFRAENDVQNAQPSSRNEGRNNTRNNSITQNRNNERNYNQRPNKSNAQNDNKNNQVQEQNRSNNQSLNQNKANNQNANQNKLNNSKVNQNKPNNQNAKQNSTKNGKQDNSVDFSKIFPREPLVHSPSIPMEKDKFTKFQRAGKWGFKDENGKEVIPPIYTEVLNFKEDMAAVEMNGLFGYINRENELVVPYKYDCAGSFSEGWANVSANEKCGYIDISGKEVVPFIYDAATAFTGEGYGRVKKDDRWGNITKDGNVDWQ